MKSFEMVENFFELDLLVKDLIIKSKPNFYNTNAVDIEENLKKCLEKMCLSLKKMAKYLNLENYINVDNIFDNYLKQLYSCNYDLNKINDFYEKNILLLTSGLETSLRKNISGYSMDNNYKEPFKYVNSVNDLLHLIHFSAINNEEFYKNDSLICTKGDDLEKINLYGIKNNLALKIYDMFPINDSSQTEILSLDNKIIIMVRDVGHATVIEIEKELDYFRVKYNIPKICNVDMINNLPGVSKVDPNNYNIFDGVNGEFIIKDDIISSLSEFICNIPTDYNMIIK